MKQIRPENMIYNDLPLFNIPQLQLDIVYTQLPLNNTRFNLSLTKNLSKTIDNKYKTNDIKQLFTILQITYHKGTTKNKMWDYLWKYLDIPKFDLDKV